MSKGKWNLEHRFEILKNRVKQDTEKRMELFERTRDLDERIRHLERRVLDLEKKD